MALATVLKHGSRTTNLSLALLVTTLFVMASATDLFPAKLPNCTQEQVDSVSGSFACAQEVFSPEGSGKCPDACCCELNATDTGTRRMFTAAGSCAVFGELDAVSVVTQSLVLPFTIDPNISSTPDACSQKSRGFCGELVGEGCQFDYVLLFPEDQREGRRQLDRDRRAAQEPDDEESPDSESAAGGTASQNEAEETGGISASTIALAVCVGLVGCVLLLLVSVYLIYPAVRSSSSACESEGPEDCEMSPGSSRGTATRVRGKGLFGPYPSKASDRTRTNDDSDTQCHRVGEIDEELMALDAQREHVDPLQEATLPSEHDRGDHTQGSPFTTADPFADDKLLR